MINEEILDQIFKNRQDSVEEKINKEYHKRIKEIKTNDFGERENIKQGIIAELYYKEGFKDGIEFAMKYLKNC